MVSRRTIITFVLVGSLEAFFQPHASTADAEGQTSNVLAGAKRQKMVSIRWENDAIVGTDRFYTQGVSMGFAHSGPSWMDPLADRLPWGQGRRTVGLELTQAMLTPEDTARPAPDFDDRPYAGILSASLALHVEHSNSYHGLKFVTGIVGPWSLAEETQKEIHRFNGSGQPQGWRHQLDNEPILNLGYEYRRKFQLAGHRQGWSVEGLPSGGAMVGNFLTQGHIAGLLRFGYNMSEDFGITLSRGIGHMLPQRPSQSAEAPSNWSVSFYGGGSANLVLRDITLDGNTFKQGPSVDKRAFVPAAGVGISVNNRSFLVNFTYVFWGKEFEAQGDDSEFGAITFSYFF